MNEIVFFNWVMILFIAVGVGVFILLFFVAAPYGQHIRKGWGPNINNKLGWFIMEVPTVIIYLLLYLISDRIFNLSAIIFLSIWIN
jgi:heme/copper-type cytochrome/quinol oxidase subunit 2